MFLFLKILFRSRLSCLAFSCISCIVQSLQEGKKEMNKCISITWPFSSSRIKYAGEEKSQTGKIQENVFISCRFRNIS